MRSSEPRFRSSSRSRGIVPLLCAAAISSTGVLALGLNASDSEGVIASGFERAFAALGRSKAEPGGPSYDGISGSEDFWLRTSGKDGIVKAVAIGQQVTLSGLGADRHLTITDVRDAGDTETHIDTAGAGARVLLITCREGDAKDGREIRLRLEAGRLSDVSADVAPRAL